MRQKTFFRLCIGIPAMLVASIAMADGNGQWLSGQEAYSKVCSYCHDRGIGPVIKGLNKSPDLVRLVVRAGNRAMPAFRQGEIDDATLTKIAEYIK
ncbi:cytochrome c [Herminiimonas sp. CN]|uniref:c-type cytochrome n=1 Tax=Herminiimonas sp. CN TaxID=1349818 RepID=UPI0004739DE4|nr:cytochrome c [Herminiimonas sp. CN]